VKYRITALRDLRAVLKDLESQIREPRFLRVGRDYEGLAMRPRELLGNWLLCAVLTEITGRSWALSDDPTGGDGAILDDDRKVGFLTEHVFIPPQISTATEPIDDRIVGSIRAKASKGEPYARGKTLIVFCEAVASWFPDHIGRAVEGIHSFEAIWALGLEDVEDQRYVYWVTKIEPVNSPAWRVRLSSDFDAWVVEPLLPKA
jgi:hypothetical protein